VRKKEEVKATARLGDGKEKRGDRLFLDSRPR
jgi:hypothetical protein